MYCVGYNGRLRTTMIVLVATRVGCMRTTRLTQNFMDGGQ